MDCYIFTTILLLSSPLILSILCAEETLDYCAQQLCANESTKHIGCNNNGQFSSSCDKPNLIEMTDELKEAILVYHNLLRNYMASGTNDTVSVHHQQPPATHMATMAWDNELAKLAELRVRQCQYQTYDNFSCANTDRFSNVGTNMRQIFLDHYDTDRSAIIRIVLRIWWGYELQYFTSQLAKNFTYAETRDPYLQDFSTMVIDDNNLVGCGAATYMVGEQRALLLACNYPKRPIDDEALYEIGTPTSECKTGKNEDFLSLCSTKEIYDS